MAMAYPERWVRGCQLAACLCLRGKVDRGPDLWELRAQALCVTTVGELVLWCHQFFRNEALGLVMHSGVAVAGRSLAGPKGRGPARPPAPAPSRLGERSAGSGPARAP
mmetsp:Transcript_46335/g.93479  ORF Transcript_46335/g.93479 Transcript_46335/m.93479 type:complete len:108 (+) Transcript_46335:89-412(+)